MLIQLNIDTDKPKDVKEAIFILERFLPVSDEDTVDYDENNDNYDENEEYGDDDVNVNDDDMTESKLKKKGFKELK